MALVSTVVAKVGRVMGLPAVVLRQAYGEAGGRKEADVVPTYEVGWVVVSKPRKWH